jgi:hypothetical protein
LDGPKGILRVGLEHGTAWLMQWPSEEQDLLYVE